MMNPVCPCQSQHVYAECCQPLHLQQRRADTAEQLMRSRYSAFVLQQIDYIIATTIPAQQRLLSHQELLDWSIQTNWQGLTVLNHQTLDKTHDLVEFKADYLNADGVLQSHHEHSVFVKIQQHWYFLDPTLPMIRTMKQPCLCGSMQKFKHCCAKYLAV